MMVTDTTDHHLVNRENIGETGKFAFTTDKYDVFTICFISVVEPQFRGGRHEVFLSTKHGIEAKNYDNLGDAAKLKPLEVELKRLEDMSESIVQDFAFMRKREVSSLQNVPNYCTNFFGFDQNMYHTIATIMF